MAKAKFASYEDAQEKLAPVKEELAVAKEELKAFRKENSIKKDTKPENEKLAKKLAKYEDAVSKKQAEVDEIKDWMKENKPAKERASKYEYPEDVVTAADKKKYRAKLRRQGKSTDEGEEKPAKEKKAPKEEKPEGKEEKPEGKEEKSSKKDKKDKKDKKASKSED